MAISEITMNVLFQLNRGRSVFRTLLNICGGVFREISKCWKPFLIFAKSFTIKIFGSSLNMYPRRLAFDEVQSTTYRFPEMGIYVVAQELNQKSKQQKQVRNLLHIRSRPALKNIFVQKFTHGLNLLS